MTDILKHLDLNSADGTQLNLDALYQIAPSAFTEVRDDKTGEISRKVNFEVLRRLLGDYVTDGDGEMYQFTWVGKNAARAEAAKPTDKTLRPVVEDSVDWDNTKNIYIEGDNLEVLKLLQRSYMGKVKMIYIDPPYNTGNDFVYHDDFALTAAEEDFKAGNVDELGYRFRKNSDTNGKFHSDWCSMIYSRLLVARSLLTEDGVIFISIGDDENANLIKICDEVFGEHNFIADICHKHRASVSNDRIISENHNHIAFYAKEINEVFAQQKNIGEDPVLDGFDREDDKGKYKLAPVDGPGGAKKGNPFYEFMGVEGYWRYSKETMQKLYDNGLLIVTENNLQKKYYEDQARQSRKKVTTWWDTDFLTSSATSYLQKLMGCKAFDNPKSINLLIRMLKMMTHFDKDALILDFFSGSATTAHAVMQMNSEDGSNRKFILVQLPEVCDEKSEVYKAGYRTICEIGEERIRRAGKKIKEESPLTTTKLDIGFRVFKVDSSNMEDVYYRPADVKQAQLDLFADNIKPDRTPEDLLFQVMLDLGITLSSSVDEEMLDGRKVFSVADGYLIACFDKDVTDETVKAIAKRHPFYAVFRDSGMANDSVMANFEQIFETYSPQTQRKVL